MKTTVNRRELFVLGAASLAMAYGLDTTFAAPHGTGRKRALLVAVQDYYRNMDPYTASSLNTKLDVDHLHQVLTNKLGFKAADITVLETKETTTKKSITDHLMNFLENSQDGDVLYFHYSGHGSYIIDAGDYLGWDQTLVPSDYMTHSHEGDIRDKDLAKILEEGLKNKTPAAFLLSFDSCYSGTITRSGGPHNRSYLRGDPPIPAADVKAGKENRAQKQPGLISPDVIANMKFTVISACRSTEEDEETEDDNHQPIGSLSYALGKALAIADEKTTYRDLFERIIDILRSKGLHQTPVMEGLMDVALLGGGVVPPASYIPVSYDGNIAELQAGQLMGLLKGSTFDLYLAGTKDFSNEHRIVAHATITQSQLTTSLLDVKLIGSHKMKDIEAARARVVNRVYTDQPLHVDLSLITAYPAIGQIKASLKDLVASKLIVLNEKGTKNKKEVAWDVQITPTAKAFQGEVVTAEHVDGTSDWNVSVKPKKVATTRGARANQIVRVRGSDPTNPRSLSLLRRSGSLLTVPILSGSSGEESYGQVLADSPQLPLSIAQALTRESRRRLVTQLTGKASRDSAQVEMQLWFCKGKEAGKDDSGHSFYEWDGDLAELKPGRDGRFHVQIKKNQFFYVKLRNRGSTPMYVSILDMTSDGSIGPLWPHPKLNGRNMATFDNSIPVGDTWISLDDSSKKPALYTFTEPIGEEMFMVIATERQFNATPLFDEKIRDAVHEIKSPLGKLLLSATTRDAAVREGAPDDWHAFSMHIDVEPEGAK